MKRFAVLMMTIVFVFSLVQAQTQKTGKGKTSESKNKPKTERVMLKKLEGNQVSQIAKDGFFADFGTIQNVKWARLGPFDVAKFMKDGKEMAAYYDIDGNQVGITMPVTFAEIPPAGQKEIKKRYKDYSIGPVLFYDDKESTDTDMMLYDTQFDDEDNYFVELAKGSSRIVVEVNINGNVTFFKQL